MNIYDVSHGNRAKDKSQWCGPAAISAVTRMTTGEAARLIRHVGRLQSVKGTSTLNMSRAFAMCGVRLLGQPVAVEHYKNKKGSLKAKGKDSITAWLAKTVSTRSAGRVFLLAAGNHWLIISGRRYVCGLTGKIVSVTDKQVKRRAKVTEVWELVGTPTIPKQAKESPTTSRINQIASREYGKFRAFMKEHGLVYKIVPECGVKYIEIEPTTLWPRGLETLHYDYDTTLGRLQHCLENPSAVVDGGYSE